MPPKKKRVRRETFLDILPKMHTIATPFFTIRSINTKTPKISVVVSKKVAKNATARNYLRRRIYHSLSGIKSPDTFIIFVKKPFENKDILEKALKELLTKIV